MYIRIMNQLDLDCIEKMLEERIPDKTARAKVKERLKSIIGILDDCYFTDRKSFEYGGFVFLITEEEEARTAYGKIIDCYGLADRQEYSECICQEESGRMWLEELYIRGSDDSIVIIFPKWEGKEMK